jgi:hypothetical protein
MKSVLLAFLSVATLVSLPAIAQAGGGHDNGGSNGGGTKGSGTVRIRNNSGSTILAVLADTDNPQDALQELLSEGQSGGSISEADVRIAAAEDGSRVVRISRNQTGTIAGLAAGDYVLTIADLTSGNVGGGFVNETSSSISVGRNQTRTITVGSGGTLP